MPTLSRWMVRLALLHLWIGFTIAMLLLAWKGQPDLLPPEIWRWIPAHINLLLVGWMVQLSLGVGYWILPRLPNTVTERGRYGFALGAAVLLNTGVWLHAGSVLIAPWWKPLFEVQTFGLLLQVLGVLSFAIHVWPRVRPVIVPGK